MSLVLNLNNENHYKIIKSDLHNKLIWINNKPNLETLPPCNTIKIKYRNN